MLIPFILTSLSKKFNCTVTKPFRNTAVNYEIDGRIKYNKHITQMKKYGEVGWNIVSENKTHC